MSTQMQEYVTIAERASDEFVERKSQFIGYVCPVSTPEEAMAFINEIKELHKQAKHNVWAYNLRDGQRRYSDDGEPQGTAGMPVLEVLTKPNIVDAAIVVTRYFGGILLGTGGLCRAYSHAAKLAVDAGRPVTMTECVIFSLSADYSMYGKITYLLPNYETQTLESDFADVVHLKLMMRASLGHDFCNAIRELSAGSILPVEEGRVFAAV